MPFTFTNLGNSTGLGSNNATNPDINSGSNATSYSNTSWTPPTTGAIVLFVESRRSGGPDTPTVSGNSLTWVQIGTTVNLDAGGNGMSMFMANASGATTGATTISFGTNTQVHCIASFLQVEGIDLSGGPAAAVVRFEFQPSSPPSANTTGTIILPAASAAGNRPLACYWHLANEVTNPRANWVELDDMHGAGQNRGVQNQYRSDAFEQTSTATWNSNANWGGIAVELKEEITALPINQTESITVTDTPTVFIVTRLLSTSDSISVTENVNLVIEGFIETLTVSVNDSVSVAESVTVTRSGPPDRLITRSESRTVTEFVRLSVFDDVKTSDSISVTENVGINTTYEISESDLVNVLDIPRYYGDEVIVAEFVSLTFGDDRNIDLDESIVVGENLVVDVSDPQIDVSESVSVAEDVDLLIRLFIDLDETVTVAEDVELLKISFIEVSEAISVVDTAELEIETDLEVSDAISVADTETVEIAADEDVFVNVSDSVSVVDTEIVENPELDLQVDDTIDVETLEIVEVPELDLDVSDAVSVAEADTVEISVAADIDITVSDSVSVAEAEIVENPLLEISESDTVSAVDVDTVDVEFLPVEVSDSVSIAENTEVNLESFISESEAIPVTEFVELLADLNIFETESITVDEFVETTVALDVDVSDSVSVVDTAEVENPEDFLDVSAAISVADAATLSLAEAGDVTIIESDNISVTEDIVLEVEVSVEASESVSVAEFTELSLESFIEVSESVSVAEDTVIEVESDIEQSEAVSVVDTAEVTIDLEVSASDTVSVAENVEVENPLAEITESDSISVAENVVVENDTLPLDVSDSISVAEFVDVTIALEIEASESISVAEDVTVENEILPLEVSDAVSVVDVATVALAEPGDVLITESDSISVSENVELEIELPVEASDAVTVAEDVILLVIAFIDVSESISVVDTATVSVEAFADVDVDVSDSVGTAEAQEFLVLSFIEESDSVSVAENTNVTIALAIEATDNISVVDTATLFKPEEAISVSESISVAENVIVVIPIIPTDQNLVRQRPHISELFLSIYKPKVVLACRVNDPAISKGERIITYTSVSEGTHLHVENGMLLYVGTTPGGKEKGKIRVREADATTLTVAENDHIQWADSDYLTVVWFFEPTAIFPRIIQDPADELNVIFYKDYDITYTNQNENLGAFPNMGPHYAGSMEGGSHQVFYTATGTSHVQGSNLTYQWWFQGATVTGSSSATPGYITYNTPGHYTTRLIVTGANGSEDRSYRHISIYNGLEGVYVNWRLSRMSGSRGRGGYAVRVILDQLADDIDDGSLAVVYSKDKYGTIEQSIGGNAENRQKIFYVGYIKDGSVEMDYQNSTTEFEVVSVTELLKFLEGFSVSVESKNSPTTWFELKNMNLKRAIYHYLKWHTTVLQLADVQFLGDDRFIQFFDADRESLYSAVNSLMQGTLVGNTVADRQGKIWLERDAYLVTGSVYTTGIPLDPQDWMGEPSIDEIQIPDLAYLEMGGIQYDNQADESFAYLSGAPGDVPGYKGGLERIQGLALNSQSDLNFITGRVFGHRNRRYPNSTFTLAGNYRTYDIAPQQRVSLVMPASSNKRRITFSDKSFLVEAMNWVYDTRGAFLFSQITFGEDTAGPPGDSIIIPTEPPGGGFEQPPFDLPPLPPINLPDITELLLYDEGTLLGPINALNFVGNAVTAALPSDLFGEVTYICSVAGATESGIFTRSRGGFTWLTGETTSDSLLGITTVDWASGINWDTTAGNEKCIFLSDGEYVIKASNEVTYSNVNVQTTFNGVIKIQHFDKFDVLKATYTISGDPAFKYQWLETDTGNTGTISLPATISYGISAVTIMAFRDDYLKFQVSTSPAFSLPTSHSVTAVSRIVIYRP